MGTGPALGCLIQGSENLSSLDVSFNMVQGEGAYALIRGVYENAQNGGQLRDLDLSWNCLGQGPSHGNVARIMGSVFQDCEVLFHVDMSYNNIDIDDCTLLAD